MLAAPDTLHEYWIPETLCPPSAPARDVLALLLPLRPVRPAPSAARTSKTDGISGAYFDFVSLPLYV